MALILLVNVVIEYILTPTAWDIIIKTSIDLIDFNVSMTLYMFICMILLYFIASYFVLAYKLYKHHIAIKKELNKFK